MLEILIPIILFVIILVMCFFLFKTVFKILAIFSGVLIIGTIVAGALLYIDAKTYMEQLPKSPLLITFTDQEEVVGALQIVMQQNKVQPLAQEEPTMQLIKEEKYEEILKQGYFKVILVDIEVLDLTAEQEEQFSQNPTIAMFVPREQDLLPTGTRPKKGTEGEYEQVISEEDIERLQEEQQALLPQNLQDPLQIKTMLYSAALMQKAQEHPEELQEALKEEKIKVYKTTITVWMLKYIPASMFKGIIKGA